MIEWLHRVVEALENFAADQNANLLLNELENEITPKKKGSSKKRSKRSPNHSTNGSPNHSTDGGAALAALAAQPLPSHSTNHCSLKPDPIILDVQIPEICTSKEV